MYMYQLWVGARACARITSYIANILNNEIHDSVIKLSTVVRKSLAVIMLGENVWIKILAKKVWRITDRWTRRLLIVTILIWMVWFGESLMIRQTPANFPRFSIIPLSSILDIRYLFFLSIIYGFVQPSM